MMLERIVEVFCEVDDFCKAFVPHWEASLLGTGGPAPRGPHVDQRDHHAAAHSSGFKHLKSFYHGFAEPLAPFPACPATSTSSPCRKASSCRWCSSVPVHIPLNASYNIEITGYSRAQPEAFKSACLKYS